MNGAKIILFTLARLLFTCDQVTRVMMAEPLCILQLISFAL